ncbi:histidine phosphotransferase family protein [Paracoccus jiaweipingae]|uniref:histidine phosphotransferase family protein n=1 Tax=unclassified Paracoccus (in: a-proteobacteria) TaxID=2688777 RepID=UPI0037B18902
MSGAASQPAPDATMLAGLIGSRLCHDLVSPLGAIGNGVELLEMAGLPGLKDSPEMALIADSLRAARARVQIFRIAFGQAAGDQRMSGAQIRHALDDLQTDSRLRVELSDPADLPRSEVRILILALLCLQDAMPWGGRVLAARSGPRWRLVAEAERMKPDTGLWRWLDATPEAACRPSEVQFPLLAAALAGAGRRAVVELDDKGAELTL